MPQVLLFQPHGLPKKIADDADELRAQVGPATAGRAGPAFNPRGAKVLAALDPLNKDCETNGTPTGVLATSGG